MWKAAEKNINSHKISQLVLFYFRLKSFFILFSFSFYHTKNFLLALTRLIDFTLMTFLILWVLCHPIFFFLLFCSFLYLSLTLSLWNDNIPFVLPLLPFYYWYNVFFSAFSSLFFFIFLFAIHTWNVRWFLCAKWSKMIKRNLDVRSVRLFIWSAEATHSHTNRVIDSIK